MHKNKDIRILLRYNFEKSGEKMLPSSRSRQQLKISKLRAIRGVLLN